jgi:hypothetical protein
MFHWRRAVRTKIFSGQPTWIFQLSDQNKTMIKEIYNKNINYIRDWKIVVLIFAIGLISLSLFAWRIYLSNKIAGGYLEPVTEPSGSSLKMIDLKKLQADLLQLETKQADYLKAKAKQNSLIDPSL